jgi:alkaline phosphatase
MICRIVLILLLYTAVVFPQNNPKNIIILIGDGMGLNYVSAHILQNEDSPFQKFTTIGLSITGSTDNLITDSGASATAISTGYRTYNLSIGMDTARRPLTNIMQLAKKTDKSTGIVATSSVTHATPAAFAAHVPNRNMEIQIAEQMMRSGIDVVIGGGLGFFSSLEKAGMRPAEDDLIDSLKWRGYNLYTSFDQLQSSEKNQPFYALLEVEALQPAGKRDYELKDLVVAALNHLSLNENGFILMVEGSQIDWAAHDNLSDQVIREMNDFSGAVNTALEFAEKDENTLVLVTSDHETGGGAVVRGKSDGTDLILKFSSDNHTPSLVGIFAKGPGEKNFGGIMRINEIGRRLIRLIQPGYLFY